jgi:hypothetical protein
MQSSSNVRQIRCIGYKQKQEMKMRRFSEKSGSLLLVLLLLVSPLAYSDGHWSKNWHIEITGKSTSAGSINFNVAFQTAEDGTSPEPVAIEVIVSKKVKDKAVADLVTNNFRAVLGGEKFKVDRKFGNKVRVKAKGDTPKFVLQMSNNTVQGLSVKISD